jgi:hypothetical protein
LSQLGPPQPFAIFRCLSKTFCANHSCGQHLHILVEHWIGFVRPRVAQVFDEQLEQVLDPLPVGFLR